jgi:hypothetical protein
MKSREEKLIDADFERAHHEIAELAFYKYEQHGCTPSHELDDWLEAESEIMTAYRLY